MAVFIDLTGLQFGRLTARRYLGKRYWLCECSCGRRKRVYGGSLKGGRSHSCGCLRAEHTSARNTTHGRVRTPEHRAWTGLKRRCFNPGRPEFPNYGGRGITVCDRWRDSFEAFYADMGPRPSRLHSIDRIDNDGPYSPENCRWALRETQNQNRRNCRQISAFGETSTVSAAARAHGLNPHVLFKRLRLGWPVERALSEPVRHR